MKPDFFPLYSGNNGHSNICLLFVGYLEDAETYANQEGFLLGKPLDIVSNIEKVELDFGSDGEE